MNHGLIIYGGESVEHEISIISALQAYKNYQDDKYSFELVYLSKDKNFYVGEKLKELKNYQNLSKLIKSCHKITFKKNKINNYYQIGLKKHYFDFVWLIVHGQNCEDGSLYSYFNMKNIICIAQDQYVGALCQDKLMSKQYLKSFQVKQIPFTYAFLHEYNESSSNILNRIEKIGFPVIIKPSHLGSSIGIQVAKNYEELIDAMELCFKFDQVIIIEKYLENKQEFNISLLGANNDYKVSLIEEVTNKNILTYDDKYKSNNSKGMASLSRIVPAKIEKKLEQKIQNVALKIANVLNCSLLVRLDFIYDVNNKELYFNEINSIPGSLAFYLWENELSFTDLINSLIDLGLQLEYSKKYLITTYQENVFADKKFSSLKLSK